MRYVGAASVLYMLAMAFAMSGLPPTLLDAANVQGPPVHGGAGPLEGRAIFRYDTFGDEQFWTDVLRMHEAVQAVDPVTAFRTGTATSALARWAAKVISTTPELPYSSARHQTS